MKDKSPFKFRLYIAGNTQNSIRAKENLDEICRENLPESHEVEVIDVLCEPKRALNDGIMMTPTLLKLAPHPAVGIVGTLSNRSAVLHALDLEVKSQ